MMVVEREPDVASTQSSALMLRLSGKLGRDDEVFRAGENRTTWMEFMPEWNGNGGMEWNGRDRMDLRIA